MRIHEFGEMNEKKMLFFQGSCEPWQEFSYAAKLLANKYHVFLVTPDGHDPQEGNDFISVEKTVKDTIDWLKERKIDHLQALYGLSFGGAMALCFLVSQEIKTDKAIIDAGTAPYLYPKWLCRLICVRDFMMLLIGRSSLTAMKIAFPPEHFARDIANADEEYRQIKAYLKTYSWKTIWNIFWSANNYRVVMSAPRMESEIQFWVGTKEWGSRYRDLKWYRNYLPQMEVIRIPGMMHGELVMMHPEEFYERAMTFLADTEKKEGK